MNQITPIDLSTELNLSTVEAEQIYNNYKKFIDQTSQENFLKITKLLRSKFNLTQDYLTEIALSNFKTFLMDPASLDEGLSFFQKRLDLIPIKTRSVLMQKAHRILSLPTSELEKRINTIKEENQLNDYMLRQIITQTSLLKSNFYSFDIKLRFDILKEFGISSYDLKNAYILSHNTKNLIQKLKIATLANQDIKEYCNSYFSTTGSPTAMSYARYMAIESGNADIKNIFCSAQEFMQQTGFSSADLISMFPFNGEKQIELDCIFASNYPQIDKQIENIKRELYAKKIKNRDYSRQELYDLLELINISAEDFENVITVCPELLEADLTELKSTINFLFSSFNLTTEDVLFIIKKEPQNLLISSDRYNELSNFLYKKIGIKKRDLGKLLAKNNLQNNFEPEFLENYINSLKTICNFTNQDLSNLVATSGAFGYATPNRLYCKLKLFENYGFTKEDFNNNFDVLTQKFRNLKAKFMLLRLEGYSEKELLSNKHFYKIPISILYPRFAHQKQVQTKTTIFATDGYYNGLYNTSTKELQNKFPYSREKLDEIANAYKEKFPQDAKRLEYLGELYEQVKEESITRLDPPQIAIDKIKKAEEILNYKNELDSSTHTSPDKMRENLNNLLSLGYLVEEIKANPNALLVEPTSLVVRATLAKKMGISHLEFLTSGYRKQEDKVYARLCGLRASLRDYQLVYSNEKTFEKETSLSTTTLTSLFPYSEKTTMQILTAYENIVHPQKEEENEQ